MEEYKKCARCGALNQASILTSSGLCLYCAWREYKKSNLSSALMARLRNERIRADKDES